MKHLIILCLSFSFVFSACKKGADDPELSLRSRKARLNGHWVLKKGTTSYTQGGSNVSMVFDGAQVKQYFSNTGIYYYGKSSLAIDFNKEGELSVDETVAGNRSILTGHWMFNAKSENYKSKELLTMQVHDITSGSTYNCYLMQFSSTCTYHIERLSKDELVLLGAGSFRGSNNAMVNYTSEFHLEKK